MKPARKPLKKKMQYGVLVDFTSGIPVKINVHSEPVLEETPVKRWILHWVGTEDHVDYGQIGQLGLFHHVVELDQP